MLAVMREHIVEEVKSANFVAIQADETTDVSTQTQLVLVLRYIDSNHKVQERFFEFLPISESTSVSIASVLLERLNGLFADDEKVKPWCTGTVPGSHECALPLYQVLMSYNLQETFSETVTLLNILITTPMTTAEAERCFSTLTRVKTFLRNSMGQERLNALAML
ncbi:hypothetical protein J4Q44_G00294800, partial [Coregonus suidteri]